MIYILDKCIPPCKNGGTCLKGKCNCKPNCYGPRCGRCYGKRYLVILHLISIKLLCIEKRNGKNHVFQTKFLDMCVPNPCQNGGTCRKKDGTCKCTPDCSGKYCRKCKGKYDILSRLKNM